MPAQDRGDIMETYARYAWGIDLADADLALSSFARDASFDHLWQGEVRGGAPSREQIRSAVEWGGNIVAYAAARRK